MVSVDLARVHVVHFIFSCAPANTEQRSKFVLCMVFMDTDIIAWCTLPHFITLGRMPAPTRSVCLLLYKFCTPYSPASYYL